MKKPDFSFCLVSQDETRGLRSALRRHVSWFVVATTGVGSWSANAGCTKHIFGVGQGASQGVSTAARAHHGAVTRSSSRPRNSAVPRRRPSAWIQKDGLIPDRRRSPGGSGRGGE